MDNVTLLYWDDGVLWDLFPAKTPIIVTIFTYLCDSNPPFFSLQLGYSVCLNFGFNFAHLQTATRRSRAAKPSQKIREAQQNTMT